MSTFIRVTPPPAGLIGVDPQLFYIDSNATLSQATTAGFLSPNSEEMYGCVFPKYFWAAVRNTTANISLLLGSVNQQTGVITLSEFIDTGTANNLVGGLANQIVYQTAPSTTSFLATANNGVLVTSSGGVPSISSTLPASLTITTPIINQINDPNGNGVLQLSNVASAVNYIQIANDNTTNAPSIATVGSDTNINLDILAKGSGYVAFLGGSSAVTKFANILSPGQILTFNIASLTGAVTATWPNTSGTVALADTNNNLSYNNFNAGFVTTATAAGTTVLTVASAQEQWFTGSTTQTVTLPVVSTLAVGFKFIIGNQSSGNVTVQSSGANTIATLTHLQAVTVICTAITGTGTASWSWFVNTLGG